MKPERPFTPYELRALLDACLTPRDRALLLLLIATGLRISEALGITAGDIDWREGVILIRGKGQHYRYVAPGKAVLKALGGLVNGGGPVWLTKDGRAVSRKRARQNLYAIAERAGVAGAHPHRFRVTYAHDILVAGGDLLALKDSMGHRRIEQTIHYAAFHASSRALDQQRRLNPADRLLDVTAARACQPVRRASEVAPRAHRGPPP